MVPAYIPNAIKAAMVNISPIANGRFDRTANALLNDLCKKTNAGAGASVAGFPLPFLPSNNGGGVEPKRMTFLVLLRLLVFFFLVLLSGSASAS